MWKDQEGKIKMLQTEEQFIHVEVHSLDNTLQYYATIVYAKNQLDKIRVLWEQIDSLGSNINLPWIVLGDYNSVLYSKDRNGGNQVNVAEYKDLAEMMPRQGLFEVPSKGCHFTW